MAVCVRSVAASRYIRLQVGQGRGSWKASLRFSSPFFSGTGISKKEESMESRFLAAQYSKTQGIIYQGKESAKKKRD